MLTFCHSGTNGDLLASLPAIRFLGGGKLLLKLNNTGIPGRMNVDDYLFLRPLLLSTGYINEFAIYQSGDLVNYDLDRFRLFFERSHLIDLIRLHFLAIGKSEILDDQKLYRNICNQKIFENIKRRTIKDKHIGISRTPRHRDGSPDHHYFWSNIIDNGLEDVGIFFGLDEEHALFEDTFKIKIYYQKVNDALELAEYIAGVECFITSQTMNFWIATGLQKTTMLETRQMLDGRPHYWSNNEHNLKRPHGFVMPYNWSMF